MIAVEKRDAVKELRKLPGLWKAWARTAGQLLPTGLQCMEQCNHKANECYTRDYVRGILENRAHSLWASLEWA